ncbi:iron ABC transporter permease [Sporosarcina sp.]|uniref:FecCD family ABC transporter permease n=1 Tax=Sporosarcina sp. TaxID=49982 RepID=UPI00260EFFC8|nr:iron ABC transporter permease [Sporosarcina sp.]
MRSRSKLSRFITVFLVGLSLGISLMYLSLATGVIELSHLEIIRTLFGLNENAEHRLVIFEFRIPRIIIAALIGCALGMVGTVLQGITKNELADPGILGIQAAVGFSVVCYMFIQNSNVVGMDGQSIFSMSLFGWLGGVLAAVFLFLFSRSRGELDPKRLLLVGIAINAGFGALTLFVSLKMNPQDFEMATVWLSGSIYSASWEQIYSILPWLFIIVPLLVWKSRTLNLLQLDEVSMVGLGLRANRIRLLLLVGSVGLISSSVIVSGSISFVGLIAPHIARRLVGIHNQYVLPISGVIGMLLVVTGDWIGRTIFSPAELPVGIVISIIGVPYFVYLLMRSSRSM